MSKNSTILLKSETKNKSSGDDYQSKFTFSTHLKCKNPAEDFSFKKIDTMSDAIHESGQSFDSQETISDNSLFPEIYENETPKNFDHDELQKASTGFSGNLEIMDAKSYLE